MRLAIIRKIICFQIQACTKGKFRCSCVLLKILELKKKSPGVFLISRVHGVHLDSGNNTALLIKAKENIK